MRRSQVKFRSLTLLRILHMFPGTSRGTQWIHWVLGLFFRFTSFLFRFASTPIKWRPCGFSTRECRYFEILVVFFTSSTSVTSRRSYWSSTFFDSLCDSEIRSLSPRSLEGALLNWILHGDYLMKSLALQKRQDLRGSLANSSPTETQLQTLLYRLCSKDFVESNPMF